MFDYTYLILVLPAVIFAFWAQANVQSTYKKQSKQYSARGITGAAAARAILDENGLQQIRIECIAGELTDHFDPKSGVIRLSRQVYEGSSCASIGVAAHETGHAIQHQIGYVPLKIRSAIIPVTNIGSRLAMPLVLIGLLFLNVSNIFLDIAYIGIACFALSTLFQLVTLPTEFDASRRALHSIERCNLLTEEEASGAARVLRAAALTYVAALAVSLMQLLRLIMLVNGNRRRR